MRWWGDLPLPAFITSPHATPPRPLFSKCCNFALVPTGRCLCQAAFIRIVAARHCPALWSACSGLLHTAATAPLPSAHTIPLDCAMEPWPLSSSSPSSGHKSMRKFLQRSAVSRVAVPAACFVIILYQGVCWFSAKYPINIIYILNKFGLLSMLQMNHKFYWFFIKLLPFLFGNYFILLRVLKSFIINFFK